MKFEHEQGTSPGPDHGLLIDDLGPPDAQRNSCLVRKLAGFLPWLLSVPLLAWGTLALYFSPLPPMARLVTAIAYALVSLLLLLISRPRWKGRLSFLVLFAGVLGWWLLLSPSNNRDWQPDVALLPYATFSGNEITVHNIRDCDYRSETDYDVRHYDHTYNLGDLQSADLFLVYWGSPLICHTMISFGFGGGQQLCISIETRKEKGESYSAIKGFFKQFELIYVVADERDVVRLRTNYRHEDVYLYRLRTTPELLRKVFLHYLQTVNSLYHRPEWYNALSSNCTTNIRRHTRPYVAKPGWSWKILVNGFVDEFIYSNGALDQSLALPELKKRSRINERAQAADKAPDFSSRIREGLPGMKGARE